MRVFEHKDHNLGKAFDRISKAFHQYSPEWIEWVSDPTISEMEILHAVGGGEVIPIENCISAGLKTIIIQHTYFTSGYYDWPKLWEEANLTVSFHDLTKYTDKKFNFLHCPWGADKNTFYTTTSIRNRKVFTTGHVASTECIDKLYAACVLSNKDMYHTGEDFKFGSRYHFLPYIEDNELRQILNESQYISCLRDVEGFEMMGIEGLFCGATPIIPNIDTYDWYSKYSKVIDMKGNIVDQLVSILNEDPKEITLPELEEIRNTFDWKTIVTNIFTKIRENI